MYQYAECGLSHVYLLNGYHEEESDYGLVTSISNITGLHDAIGKNIVSEKSAALSGEEIRFLRKELDLSQKNLGLLLGVEDQTVARWEKGAVVIPRSADILLRGLYMEAKFDSCKLSELVNKLSQLEAEHRMLRIEMQELEDEQWVVSA
ncbi:MAG: helix-turn-helix domain-containing protein [Pseudomonadota bacterium]